MIQHEGPQTADANFYKNFSSCATPEMVGQASNQCERSPVSALGVSTSTVQKILILKGVRSNPRSVLPATKRGPAGKCEELSKSRVVPPCRSEIDCFQRRKVPFLTRKFALTLSAFGDAWRRRQYARSWRRGKLVFCCACILLLLRRSGGSAHDICDRGQLQRMVYLVHFVQFVKMLFLITFVELGRKATMLLTLGKNRSEICQLCFLHP